MLLETIAVHPGITRARMLELTGLPSGVVDPARIRLWQAGLIEPDTDAGWEDALQNRAKRVGWRCVYEPQRQAAVKARATMRKERNAEPPAEEQAIAIVEALEDPVVSRLVHEMIKDTSGSPRARRRAEQALRARQIARKREAAEAAREKSANADFKRNLARLWDARGAVGAIDRFLLEERARVAAGGSRKISDLDWLLALKDVRAIITSFGEMWQNLRDLGGRNEPCPACGTVPVEPTRALGTFVIEGEAIDISDGEWEVMEDDAVTEEARRYRMEHERAEEPDGSAPSDAVG
jgi:hypothetical protein